MSNLPAIPAATPEACTEFLRELFKAGAAFHPEDSPHEIVHHTPAGWERVFTDAEADHLAECLEVVYSVLPDPCAVLLALDEESNASPL